MTDENAVSRRSFLASALTVAGAGAAPAAHARGTPPTFMIVYRSGPNWLPGKPLAEQPLREHGRYMLWLFQQGVLQMAGGFGDQSGGSAIIYASDDDEARRIANEDPAVKSGVFVFELHRWMLVDWAARLQ